MFPSNLTVELLKQLAISGVVHVYAPNFHQPSYRFKHVHGLPTVLSFHLLDTPSKSHIKRLEVGNDTLVAGLVSTRSIDWKRQISMDQKMKWSLASCEFTALVWPEKLSISGRTFLVP